MSRRALTGTVFALAIAAAGAPASAQSWSAEGFPREALIACGADARALCPNIAPGGGRILHCLMSARADVSERCAATLDRAMILRDAVFACAADAERHCKEVAPGGGRVVACLEQRGEAVSRDCRAALDTAAAAFE